MFNFKVNESINIPTASLIFHPIGYDIIYTDDSYDSPRHCYSFSRAEKEDIDIPVEKDMTATEIVDAAVNGFNNLKNDKDATDFFEIMSIEKYCEISGEDIASYKNTIARAAEICPKGNLVLVRAGWESWSYPTGKDPAVLVILAIVEADMNIAQIVL